MSRMNSATHKICHELLKVKYGEFCMMCLATSQERELEIDHIDNNNSNNDPSNIQFLCRSCNYKKNPRLAEREPVALCGGVSEKESESLYIPTEIAINRTNEPLVRKYVKEMIEEHGELSQQELVYSSAEKFGLSPKTTIKYIRKMCSMAGDYKRISKGVQYYIIKK